MGSGRKALAVVALAAALGVCAPPATVRELLSPAQLENCFASRLNHERAKRSIRMVPRSSSKDAGARQHSVEMSEAETIYHSKADGTFAENVGMGPDCDSIHSAFMESSGHRENILDPRWELMGIGVAVREETVYVTERFYPNAAPRPAPKATPKRASPKPSCGRP